MTEIPTHLARDETKFNVAAAAHLRTVNSKLELLLRHFILISLCLILLTAVGCRTYTPQEMEKRDAKLFLYEERHTPKKLKQQLQPGMTRDQTQALYKSRRMSSYLRPETGWKGSDRATTDPYNVIATYERLHQQTVQRCDVFESPVGHSFLFQLLPDIDYLFFNASNKLIGFHHEIVGD